MWSKYTLFISFTTCFQNIVVILGSVEFIYLIFDVCSFLAFGGVTGGSVNSWRSSCNLSVKCICKTSSWPVYPHVDTDLFYFRLCSSSLLGIEKCVYPPDSKCPE